VSDTSTSSPEHWIVFGHGKYEVATWIPKADVQRRERATPEDDEAKDRESIAAWIDSQDGHLVAMWSHDCVTPWAAKEVCKALAMAVREGRIVGFKKEGT
jgi:hypothetical protein